jgi:hypothetical protein
MIAEVNTCDYTLTDRYNHHRFALAAATAFDLERPQYPAVRFTRSIGDLADCFKLKFQIENKQFPKITGSNKITMGSLLPTALSL